MANCVRTSSLALQGEPDALPRLRGPLGPGVDPVPVGQLHQVPALADTRHAAAPHRRRVVFLDLLSQLRDQVVDRRILPGELVPRGAATS